MKPKNIGDRVNEHELSRHSQRSERLSHRDRLKPLSMTSEGTTLRESAPRERGVQALVQTERGGQKSKSKEKKKAGWPNTC